MNEYGVVTAPQTVQMERLLPGPVERVWTYLIDPEKRGTWLAAGEMELRLGGRVELKFAHADLSSEKEPPEKYKNHEGGSSLPGHITEFDPPHLLAYTWGDGPDASEVRFELSPRGKKVLLVLTHRRLADRATMISVAGGWHTHLGILIDQLEGRAPRPFWSTHAALEKEYEKRFSAT